jgi:hypothetical protein
MSVVSIKCWTSDIITGELEMISCNLLHFDHKRMARGGHGLPKVSLGPAMPYPNTPCGLATSETALRLFQGWPVYRAGGLQPSYYPLGHPTPYASDFDPRASTLERGQRIMQTNKKGKQLLTGRHKWTYGQREVWK